MKIIEKVRLKMAKNLDNYLADRVLTRQLYLMRYRIQDHYLPKIYLDYLKKGMV